MSPAIYIINPNSSANVTQGIDAALAPLRIPNGPRLICQGLASGPAGVQTQQDVDAAALALVQHCQALPDDCAAIVIACFSDPGLYAVREVMQPRGVAVLGISECAMLTALTLGQRVGVIAILDSSIPRHMRYYGAMGISSRIAGEAAIGLGVTELADQERTLARMVEVGQRLVQEQGANVLVMGCAGMAPLRDALAAATGVPVVEPTQAAAAMALGRTQLGW